MEEKGRGFRGEDEDGAGEPIRLRRGHAEFGKPLRGDIRQVQHGGDGRLPEEVLRPEGGKARGHASRPRRVAYDGKAGDPREHLPGLPAAGFTAAQSNRKALEENQDGLLLQPDPRRDRGCQGEHHQSVDYTHGRGCCVNLCL